jgi:leader peptidase (prepilin peptidase)/N-methyltransferase
VGGVVGRFLDACIHDLPLGRAVRWPSLVPSRPPIIELLTATMFAGAFWYYGPTALLLSRVVLGCALIVLFVVDLEHRLLPNVITLPGIAIGFAFSLVTDPGWLSSLIGIAGGGGILFATAEAYYRVRKVEGLGMGDVKMLAMIGAFLGWPGTLLTLLMGSMAGSIVGLVLIILRRGDMQYGLPFGTFLAMGAALSATVGAPLIDWYLKQQ